MPFKELAYDKVRRRRAGQCTAVRVPQKVLLLVTMATDSLAVTTIAGTPFESAIRSTYTSGQMPQEKTGLPIEGPRTTSKNGCCKDIAGESRVREDKKIEIIDLRICDVLVGDVFWKIRSGSKLKRR